MSSTLSPNACPAEAWKTWLRDGARMVGRSGTGWGICWLLFFFARGWCLDQSWLLGNMVFLGLTFFGDVANLAIMTALREGRVGLAAAFSAIGNMLRQHGKWVLRGVLVRTGINVCFFMIIHVAFAWWVTTHAQSQSLPSPPPVPLSWPWWEYLFQISASVSYVALFLRAGGLVSFILPLQQNSPMPLKVARHLNGQAFIKNPKLYRLEAFLRPAMLLVFLMAPILMPVAELLIAGVISCAYADIFDQGYQVKSTVTAKSSITHAVPA